MATRPIICPYVQAEGIKFDRTNLVIDSNNMTTPQVIDELGDLIFDIQAYSKSFMNLVGFSCGLISQSDIADTSGFVSFIIIKATFSADTLEKDKYLTWQYRGDTYYMGELLILSGPNLTTFDSEQIGWNLAKPGPVYQDGGITICNPHADKTIKVEFLVCR
jgi:hypothetical protein